MKNIVIISYIYFPYNAPAARRPYRGVKYLNKIKSNVAVLKSSNPDSLLGIDSSMNNELPDMTLVAVQSFIKSSISSDFRDSNTINVNRDLKIKVKNIIERVGAYF